MKAPDKVFVHTGKLGFLCASKINTTGNDTEYIRKDAVLELLQKRNKEINGASKALFRSYELQEIYWRINEL